MLIGLDLGGTSIKAVRVDEADGTVTRTTAPVGGNVARDVLLGAIADTVSELAGGHPVDRLGFAVGGLVRPDGTMHLGSTNLPNLAGVPLESAFSQRFGVPCRVDHDARSAMRGEAWLGAAANARNAMTVTFGTGIGAGLLLDGRIYAGTLRAAGEIGVFSLMPSADGAAPPTMEEVASPVELERRTGRPYAELFQAYVSGAPEGAAMSEALKVLGLALGNAHLLLDLEVIALIGGVTAIGEPFRNAVESAFRSACPVGYHGALEFRLGALGAHAGAVGAAALWRDAGDNETEITQPR